MPTPLSERLGYLHQVELHEQMEADSKPCGGSRSPCSGQSDIDVDAEGIPSCKPRGSSVPFGAFHALFPPGEGSEPSDNHLLVQWMERHICLELSAMQRRLDVVANNVERLSRPETSHAVRPALHIPSKAVAASGEASNTTTTTTAKSSLKKVRTKIRFISTLASAAKRTASGTDLASADSMPTVKGAKLIAPSSSAASTVHTVGGILGMSGVWDSVAEVRMKQIQGVLNADKQKTGLRSKLWRLMESPYSSKGALIYAWVTHAIVISSVFFAALDEPGATQTVQLCLEVLFAVEFLLRFVCCPHQLAFLGSFFNWIDLMSAAPLCFRMSGPSSSASATVLGLVPMLRLFKPLRRFEQLRLMVDAFSAAVEALPMLLYMMTLIAIVFAEVIWFLEPRSNIPDLPTALWFTLVTMTTVGYGGVTPVTTGGHIAASILMLVSCLYMALPIGIVGDAFSKAWMDRDRLLVVKRFRSAFLKGGFSVETFQYVFSVFDEDGSGTLDFDEFAAMLKVMQLKISDERMRVLFATLDTAGAGQISLDALINGLAPKAIGAQLFQISASRALSWNPLQILGRSSQSKEDLPV